MEIIIEGNELLRKKSEEIKNFNTTKLISLVNDLKTELQKLNGVGLAAPQFGILKRIFIVHSFPNKRYPNAPEFGPVEIINPKITRFFTETEKDWEGCLSIKRKDGRNRGRVERYKKIEVEFLNVQGDKFTKIFEGFIARVFQHEYDHLEGTLFIDKINQKDLVTEEEYLKIINK